MATTPGKPRLEYIWSKGAAARQDRIAARREPPLVRLWDGAWTYIGRVADALEGSAQWRMNETGQAVVSVPTASPIARAVLKIRGRTTDRNIHITIDKDGARWGGRLKRATTVKEDDGTHRLDLLFLHDYEELKHVYCWPNPWTPAAVQWPRAFFLAGPTAWMLKITLLFNLMRINRDLAIPLSDALDPDWMNNNLTLRNWAVVVAPGIASADPSPWSLISSRMKTWHDVAKPRLDEMQLSVECRRWLRGDPPPWAGADLRHGTLVVDIVDRSGYWSEHGTSLIGRIGEALVNTVQALTGSQVDVVSTPVSEPVEVPEYRKRDWLGTVPWSPYVVYREGPLTGIESSEYSWEPASSVQEITGGKSAYGVNEAISAAVQLAGNYLGLMVMLPSAGGIADTFLKPLYEDTILAWMVIASAARAQNLGWSRYYEHFASGADRAYTVSSIVALRKGFWDTRERVSFGLHIADGAPWFIGDRGQGHFFLGDRIGAAILGAPEGTVIVEQVTELTYSWSRDERGWKATCGDPTIQRSPLETVVSQIREATGAIHDLGVI